MAPLCQYKAVHELFHLPFCHNVPAKMLSPACGRFPHFIPANGVSSAFDASFANRSREAPLDIRPYGLQAPHGLYPPATASSLVAKTATQFLQLNC